MKRIVVYKFFKAMGVFIINYCFADRYEGITGSAIRRIFALLSDPEIISFAGGNPSASTFPSSELAEFSRKLLESKGDVLLQYGNTVGMPSLIEGVEKLLRAEGLSPESGEIIILTGSSQGIELMSKAFLNAGDVVLAEDPSFLGALQTFRLYQAEVRGVKMDEEGIVLEDLEAKIKKYRPKFLYTIPTFQNPTGRTLSASRRKQLVELCTRENIMVLEDDPYAALRFEGTACPSLKSFDTAGNVVKLISFSKTISPGLRVGAAYANRDVITKFNLGKQGMDVLTPNLNQELVANYIASDSFPRRIKANCELYSHKLDLMYSIASNIKSCTVHKPNGGMFLWMDLPEHMNAEEMFKEAVDRKVAYVPGTHFYPEGGHLNTIRLNFTMVDDDKIQKGMEILSSLINERI